MSERAEQYAGAFERANDEVISALESCSESQLQAACDSEGWKAACVGHHVGVSHSGVFGLVQLIANGQPVPALTMDMFDAQNAEHAREFENVSREETLALLRKAGSETAALVRGLSDEQLDRKAPMAFAGGQEWSAAEVIERILIGHPTEHAASIRAVAAS